MSKGRWAVRTLLLLSLAAGPAYGDATGIAIELFTQGKQLMNAGDYAEARVRLLESARLDPKVGTLASLAVCEERLGHLAEARARWLQARTLAAATSDPRRPLTETELARLDNVVPKLRIELRGGAPEGLVIKADDLEVGPGMLATPLPVNPGDHAISATARGKKPWSAQVHTEADGKVTSVVVGPLENAAASPVVADASGGAGVPAIPGPPAVEPGRGWRGQRTFGVLVAGAGVTALAVGGAFGLQAIVKKNSRGKFCDANNVCDDPQGVSLDRDARTAATTSTILMAAGGAAAAAGLVLVFTAPRAAAAVTVGAGFRPGGAELTWVGSW
jgi:serine/threonine-protein kinase